MRLVEGVATVDDVGDFVGRIGDIADESGTTVQVFDARYVVSRRHLERAVELADRAIVRGENVARDRAVEILCYAAGRRQIDRALTLGVDEGETPVVALVDAGGGGTEGNGDSNGDGEGDEAAAEAALADLLGERETLGTYDESLVSEYFGIGEMELRAADGDLEALVLERVALLDVEK
ncbi:KEOPS complex subunit Cgi121 [Halogranum gelatinilyticum]|uniref:KEOPS complex subunit Cgi121 n=1 Tax=Halogranum gelatinilyticum TaxID=660521 RepID=A0A1G9NV69_9EURY|nr:KEOPS complex subunit Cgi121 [Halogranum gelatinilyticum]SDL90203.1 KEOPS complex subunit Cgi121 [Halogranum gelatinilyticum]